MSFGIYIHIPYCIQRCRYCDFTTFEAQKLMPPADYVALVKRELKSRSHLIQNKQLSSLYFGGGTPSLIPAELIVSLIEEIANCGFEITNGTEVTIEINPATVDKQKLKLYLSAGVNRFSVGAQSFSDELLTLCGREHNAEDTRKTLELLNGHDLNYSFDLLFALPTQKLSQLQRDLKEVEHFQPAHLSAYCLTVPEGHPMASNRPCDGQQVAMFKLIEDHLLDMGLDKYEISNFARSGWESKHNLLYWQDQEYWGLGLSAHSYLKNSPWGTRFWNSQNFSDYIEQVDQPSLPSAQLEELNEHESLTDFCHTSLRLRSGLSLSAVRKKFTSKATLLQPRLESLQKRGLLKQNNDSWRLTQQGETLSNRVFSELTFLFEDLV